MIRGIIVAFIIMFLSQTVSAQGNHISIGIGPSMLYSDNSGIHSDLRFKIEPAITLSINQQLNEFIGLRGSIGIQIFNTGEYDPINSRYVINWGNEDQAFDFKGRGYFADAVPIFTTNPNSVGKLMSSVQFYAGLGFGLMFVEREQKTLKNGVLINPVLINGVTRGELVEGDIITSNETNLIPYVPIRTGISTNLSGDWDFGVEFVLITALNSNLDGNNYKYKQVKPDMMGQIQLTAKWYFGPAW